MGKVVNNSDLFLKTDADAYFERNRDKRSFMIDYLLGLFPRKELADFDVAEFGIGGGHNLHLLSHYVHRVHGYEGSSEAVDAFRRSFQQAVNPEKFDVARVNLCDSFEAPIAYDLVIYGFFAYLVSNPELKRVKKNLEACLKPGGFLYVYDFLTREPREKSDHRNKDLRIFKRDLGFWMRHFSGFDLVDFRLFNNDKVISYRYKDLQSTVDLEPPEDDDHWNFGALFRRRRSSKA